MSNFFNNFVEDLKDEDTTLAADGKSCHGVPQSILR